MNLAGAPVRARHWIGVAAAFILGMIGFLGLHSTRAYQAVRTPVPWAQAFLRDVRTRDDSRALARTGLSYQRGHDAARLRVAIESIPHLAAHTAARVEGVLVRESTHVDAVVEGKLIGPGGDAPFRMTLTREDTSGAWHVHDLTVAGQMMP